MFNGTKVFLLGDAARGLQYTTFAHKKLAQLRAQGLDYINKVFEIDGIEILLKLAPGGDKIFITAPTNVCRIYSEAGYASMGFIAGPNASDPATIRFNTALKFGTLSGTQINHVDLPASVDVVTTPPTKFISGEHSPHAFHKVKPADDPAVLIAKKTVVASVPPSMYSGKMRLFVQAIYGSSLRSFGAQALEVYTYPGQPKLLKMAGIVFDVSTGIYTADDGSYWVYTLSGNVRIYRVNLSPCGKILAQWMVKQPNLGKKTRSQYEAFIFADAMLDTTFSFVTGNVPDIRPMAYGWKFNWAGNRATCISVLGKTSGTGVAGDYWFETSRQEAYILRDSHKIFPATPVLTELQKEQQRWTISGTTENENNPFNFPWAKVFAWVPGWTNYHQIRFSGNAAPTTTTPDAPVDIYGWYDFNDIFQTVNIAPGISVTETYASSPVFPPDSIVYAGMDTKYNTFTETRVTHNIIIAGQNTNATSRSRTYTETFLNINTGTNGWALFTFGGQTACSYLNASLPALTDPGTMSILAGYASNNAAMCSQLTSAWGGSGAGIDCYVDMGLQFSYSSSSGSEIENSSIAIVTPFFDSEAAYLFKQDNIVKAPTTASAGVGPASGSMGGSILHGINASELDTPPILRFPFFGWAAYTDFAAVANPYITTQVSNITNKTSTKAVCYNKHGQIDARADNYTEIFDSSVYNQVLDQGNYCFTFTSAVEYYTAGSNILSPDFSYNGTFVGGI